MQKVYCYVDETGQDTKGKIFLVAVVIAGEERERIKNQLLNIEKQSGKLLSKWHKSSPKFRIKYLEEIFVNKILTRPIFFAVYSNTQEYTDLTILTTARAILKSTSGSYVASVFVDGLDRQQRRKFSSNLRDLDIVVKKVRGPRDESEPLIRLADAAAGFIRDCHENKVYTDELAKRLNYRKFFEELK